MSDRYHLLCVVDVLAMLVLSVPGVHKIHIIEVSCKLLSLTKRLKMEPIACIYSILILGEQVTKSYSSG